MTQLYLDLDGVLADFDAGYEACFGVRPSKEGDTVDWNLVRNIPDFYENLPPMADMEALWNRCALLRPIILTGIPKSISSNESVANKRAWVQKHLGTHIPVIYCRSSEKYLACRPGDILIDDWTKYRHLWIKAGGRWITHTSAEDSISQLNAMLDEALA